MSDMTPTEPNDYRESHLHRGKTYDANLAADSFDAYMATLEHHHLMQIVPKLFPDGIPRYLDFACGTARITQTIGPYAKEAIGVDISPSMIEKAQEKCPDVRFIHADLTQTKPEIGQFDLVSSFRFFGNAQSELRDQVLGVFANLVKPSGYLIVNNHRNPNSLAAILHKITGGKMEMDLTSSMFEEILARGGFRIVEKHPIGVWLFRSSMLANVGRPDQRALKRERVFGHAVFSAVAPDVILVAQRIV